VVARVIAVVIGMMVVGCGGAASSAAPLELTVLPPEEPVEIRMAIPGQRSVFLVRIDGGPADEPIELSATATGGSVEIAPEDIDPGSVAEVTVVPDPVTEESVVDVAITARRGSDERTENRTIPVFPETDTLGPEATDRFGPFIDWLARLRPELGITTHTTWQGSPLQPRLLVVSHYLFQSADWEAALEWHVMIPPNDWSRVILRRRWTEMTPSVAFEVPSVSAGDEPREIEPPAEFPR
jgi:hypothetical protein